MKHPSEKVMNNPWADLPSEAERLVRSMRRVSHRIFPYKPTAIAAAFTYEHHTLEIEELHFHALRLETVSRLFKMGRAIPEVASVYGHRNWLSLQRYGGKRSTGDNWNGWS